MKYSSWKDKRNMETLMQEKRIKICKCPRYISNNKERKCATQNMDRSKFKLDFENNVSLIY